MKIIIVLSNLGIENDKKLAQVAQGIDLIIGGNLNEKDVWRPEYIDTANNTAVIETWDRQMAAYRLDLILDKHGNVVKHRNHFFDLYTKFFKPDPSIEKIIHKYNREIRQMEKRVVGYAESEFLRCVDSESTLGDWIADIIRKKTAADMAFCAGMQSDLKKGPVKVSDIYNIFPILDIPNIKNFNVAVLELSREEIIEILEHSVGWVLDNNENGKRSILQLSGLKMVYDPNALIKHRVKEVLIDDKPLEKYKIYRVAVCDYLSSGTDRYYEIKFAAKIKNTGLFSFDILMDELKQNPHIFKRDIEGRIIKLEN